jgi:hypothetical protein
MTDVHDVLQRGRDSIRVCYTIGRFPPSPGYQAFEVPRLSSKCIPYLRLLCVFSLLIITFRRHPAQAQAPVSCVFFMICHVLGLH